MYGTAKLVKFVRNRSFRRILLGTTKKTMSTKTANQRACDILCYTVVTDISDCIHKGRAVCPCKIRPSTCKIQSKVRNQTCPAPSGRSADGQIRTRCTSKVQRDAQQIPIRSKPSPGVTETEVAQAGMIFGVLSMCSSAIMRVCAYENQNT